MKILVTGGAGFIGSNIVEYFLKAGAHVRVLDNLSTGKLENIKPFLNDIEFVNGDIRDTQIVSKAVEGIEVISHHAALPSVQFTVADPVTSNDVNIGGTVNLLNAAKDKGVRMLILASSSAIYGDTIEQPQHEAMIPKPLSPYAAQKIASEYYCRIAKNLYGLQTVCFRYYNVYGPRQNPNSEYAAVIPKFLKSIIARQSPIIYGDGKQCRDFIFVQDIAKANYRAANSNWPETPTINCATGRSITLLELLREINKVVGTEISPQFLEPRLGDIIESRADNKLMKELLEFTEFTELADSLPILLSQEFL